MKKKRKKRNKIFVFHWCASGGRQTDKFDPRFSSMAHVQYVQIQKMVSAFETLSIHKIKRKTRKSEACVGKAERRGREREKHRAE